MTKVFLDSDVILDFLLDRRPFAVHAGTVFALAEHGRLSLYTTTVSFLNVLYVAESQTTKRQATTLIRKLRTLLHLLSVHEHNVDAAIQANAADVEDHVQLECAKENQMDVFLTRNLRHYPRDPAFIMEPEVFLGTIPDEQIDGDIGAT